MPVKPIPDAYRGATPYLIVRGAAEAIHFYERAFGATTILSMPTPDGKIGHAEIKIGEAIVMLADECPERGYRSPPAYGGTPVSLLIYVEDVDARYKRAIAAGAKPLQPVQDQFYGDRSGTLADPYGHVWTIATHTEDLSPQELGRRAAEFMKKQEQPA